MTTETTAVENDLEDSESVKHQFSVRIVEWTGDDWKTVLEDSIDSEYDETLDSLDEYLDVQRQCVTDLIREKDEASDLTIGSTRYTDDGGYFAYTYLEDRSIDDLKPRLREFRVYVELYELED